LRRTFRAVAGPKRTRHNSVFLLSKNRRSYYDADAIAKPAVSDHPSANRFYRPHGHTHGNRGNNTFWTAGGGKRNCRDVWHLRSEPTTEAHYATFPAKHARRCVLAGSRPADLVLDPFTGAGTIRCVSEELARRWIRLDLQAEYDGITRRRTAQMRLPI